MPSKKYTILLAEDDQFLQRMYAAKLESSGFNVVLASDGQEAIDKAEKTNPDVALVDILMPKKDGFDVLRELREKDKFKDLPIIILTNLGELEDIKRAKELGSNEYIIKSHFLPSEVISVVKKYIK
ncbi:response regulator [Patescibacteria group bacterium]|nr:response regulator [Patescibacteria group bacterium]